MIHECKRLDVTTASGANPWAFLGLLELQYTFFFSR